jgi:hypothetical protein
MKGLFSFLSKPSKRQKQKAKRKIDEMERKARIVGRAKGQSKK